MLYAGCVNCLCIFVRNSNKRKLILKLRTALDCRKKNEIGFQVREVEIFTDLMKTALYNVRWEFKTKDREQGLLLLE